ncbi:MAG TPA: hypothetical protein VNJ54_07940 [Plantibacter sp.]|uniref:phage tail tube protein n=1 Tax=Plantibacter sp. TaxID=1871045 RepID=UPI002C9C785D|nr:hypothetical protein [Plantibacter sp.]
MTVNSANARIFGSDADAIYLAPIGTALPTTINGVLDGAFEDVGWLHSDGITEAFTGSKTELRGHQGARVVRTRMETPGTTIAFHALESKAQTKSLRYVESNVTNSGGVRKAKRSPGQRVSARAAVIDIFDADDITVKERWVFERIEIVADGDRVFVNSDIAGYPFIAQVISDYDTYESAGAATDNIWNASVTGTPTGGTFALTVNGATTAPIAYSAAAAAVATAINALSGVTGLSGVTATGTAPIVITFPSPVTLTANGSALTGGTTPGVTVATTP